MSNVKSPTDLSAALAADAALAAYLRALADRHAAELAGDAPRTALLGRWPSPASGRNPRVIPLRETRVERLLLSSRGEPRATQRRGAR